MKNGLLIVVSGPSGVGKGEVCNMLKKLYDNVITSVSVTTRAKRPNEIEGVNYFFRAKKEYEELKNSGMFLETFEIFGNCYGTPKEFVMKNLQDNKDVLLEIDVQGALNVKEKYSDAVLVFIAPPSNRILEQRLRGRNTEDEKTISKRLDASKQELAKAGFYDYIIVNDDIKSCAKSIIDILKAEKLKISRNKEFVKNIINN